MKMGIMQGRSLKGAQNIKYADILEMVIVLKVTYAHSSIWKLIQILHLYAEEDNNATFYIKTDVIFSTLGLECRDPGCSRRINSIGKRLKDRLEDNRNADINLTAGISPHAPSCTQYRIFNL